MSQVHVYLTTNLYTQTLANENGAPVLGAILELTIHDGVTASADEVTGETWPVTLTDNSDGTYGYAVPAAANLLPGRKYLAVTSATLGSVEARSEVLILCQRDST